MSDISRRTTSSSTSSTICSSTVGMISRTTSSSSSSSSTSSSCGTVTTTATTATTASSSTSSSSRRNARQRTKEMNAKSTSSKPPEEEATSMGISSHCEEKQSDEEDSKPCVGILFLAHDGVTNPTLWQKWRDSDPEFAGRIRFYVFRNKKISHPSDFADTFDLGLRLRTKWCSSSIVKATVESLRSVLRRDTTVSMVYIVSGFDIPIQPPWALFTTRAVVTEGVPKSVVPFHTVLAMTPGEDGPFKATPGWGKRNEDVRSSLACHVQWCGLSRDHAQRIVSYPDLGRLLKLGNKLSAACCPDEWILGTILTLQEQQEAHMTSPSAAAAAASSAVAAAKSSSSPSPIIDWPITDQYRSGGKDQSPVIWKDLESTKHKVFWAPPKTYRTFTLATVVEEVSRQEGNLFFRKVGPLTEEEIDRLVPHKKAKEEAAAAATTTVAVPAAAASPVTHVAKEKEEDQGEESDSKSIVPSTPQSNRKGGSRIFGHRVRNRWSRHGCPEGGGNGCCDECG